MVFFLPKSAYPVSRSQAHFLALFMRIHNHIHCQIRHKLSIIIHEISTGWKKKNVRWRTLYNILQVFSLRKKNRFFFVLLNSYSIRLKRRQKKLFFFIILFTLKTTKTISLIHISDQKKKNYVQTTKVAQFFFYSKKKDFNTVYNNVTEGDSDIG